MLYKLLKNNLKQRTNKNFVKWRVEHRKLKATEFHHLLGSFLGGKKQNDYLLAELPAELHKQIHYKQALSDEEFAWILVTDSLENIFDYIEYLESKL